MLFMFNRIADMWCRKMHREAMWPIHGKYVCRRCGREYPVEWEARFASWEEARVQSDTPGWLPEPH
jgi:hypothetical protein